MKHIKVTLNQGQLKDITKQVRDEGGADKRFDVNLLEGKLSENKWAQMLETIEFKKDYRAWDTGNIAVEYKNNGKPSGISVTEAKYISYILVDEKQNENVAIFIKTDIFKEMCRKYLGHDKRDVKGGDNNNSSLILLPIDELLNPENIFNRKRKEPDVEYGDVPESEMMWSYICPDCGIEYQSQNKNLFKTCPECYNKGKTITMEIN
tara:strand:- start:291 stop:911 length:621 start_codon:yes stop_codon:yes gene_type:complete